MALVSFMVFGFSIKSIYDLSNDNIESYKTNEYKNKEQELKNYVTFAQTSIKSYHQKINNENITSKEEIKKLKPKVLIQLKIIIT